MIPDQLLIAKLRDAAMTNRTVSLTSETVLRLAAALAAVVGADRARPRLAPVGQPAAGELQFAVEAWRSDETRIDRIVARASTSIVAAGAYQAARELYPDELLMVRQGARVLSRSDDS